MEATEDKQDHPAPRERKTKSKDKGKERKKEKTKKRDAAKPRRGLGALLENTVVKDPTHSGRNAQQDMEQGLTQEQIIQLRTLDAEDDNDDLSRIYYASDRDLLANQTPLPTKNFVENEISGEFFRVASRSTPSHSMLLLKSKSSLRRLQRRRRRHGDDSGDGDDFDDKGPFRGFSSRMLTDVEVAIMLLGHGIVVGLSWMDSFNLGTSQDRLLKDADARRKFVCTYSGLADRSRQLFFLLFNLVLLGLMRKISRLRLQQDPDELQLKSLRLVQASMVFTTTSLLVLLIGAPSALRLTKAFENDPKWCDQIVQSGSVESSSALTRHQQCSITNAVLLSIGYLCVCIEPTLGISSSASLRRRLAIAHKSMDQLDRRNEHLEGRGLEELSINALKDLIQLHQRAVESTESVLVTKLQLRNTRRTSQ